MSKDQNYLVDASGRFPIKMWTKDVPVEDQARAQLLNIANMPFIHKHIAVMPDVHWGMGATVGSVIATKGAVIPAAVGVDIGCGMIAMRTSLTASDLPDSLAAIRSDIERAVPHGFVTTPGRALKGAFEIMPNSVVTRWNSLNQRYFDIVAKHPEVEHKKPGEQLGTLGGGNHFIEICLDEEQRVWVMLHSGSRGVGNIIGTHFINLAKKDMKVHFINLPDENLSYLSEGTKHYDDYIEAMTWAQDYAIENRLSMMDAVLAVLRKHLKSFTLEKEAINCHHNYCTKENHYGENVLVTRKGAVRAREGDLGIIPGSMGAKSYIVRGKGNKEAFCSCSHGAGRKMSRNEAKKTFSLEDHKLATAGIECRKDSEVIDETPGAYKDIDAVMSSQADLVDVVHTLKQVLCVKG